MYTHIRISKELYELLRAKAKDENRSISNCLETILQNVL